jgi:uncharacterized protein YdeI (YjbR/CyaY-like superfamily)
VPAAELETRAFASAEEWEAWLRDHHDTVPGIWIRFAKKGSGVPTVTYLEALHAALCFGWIDGQARSLDDAAYVQRFTPRRARSIWSKRNRDFATALVEAGRMQPAGLREVERAKADGRWEAAYAGPATAEIPADLTEALAARPEAQAMFENLTSQNRFAVLHRLGAAKRQETRARRIEQYVDMLARGETFYPQRQRSDRG